MDAAKSRTYLWQAWLAAALILVANPLSLRFGIGDELLREKVLPFVFFADLLLFTIFFFLLHKKESFSELFKTSPAFNVLFTLFFFLSLFAFNRVFTCKFKWARLLLMLGLLFQYTRTFHLFIIKNPFQLHKVTRNFATAEFAFGVIFLLLEMVFMFPAKSRGAFPDSFSQISWNLRYIDNLNSMGMREVEIPETKPDGKKVFFFLGDSFQYGWGVKEESGRASEIVEEKLNAEVFNLGVPGSDIVNHWENLEKISWAPDQMVVFWNPNDIHRSANTHKLRMDASDNKSQLENWPHFLTHYSYTLNWLKNEWFKTSSWNAYLIYLNQAFGNRAIFETHIDNDFKLEYQQAGGDSSSKTLVVLFPLMGNVTYSKPWTDGMEEWLKSKGWEVLNLTPLLEEYPLEKLRVNKFDMHPSAFVHAIVADTVAKRLRKPFIP